MQDATKHPYSQLTQADSANDEMPSLLRTKRDAEHIAVDHKDPLQRCESVESHVPLLSIVCEPVCGEPEGKVARVPILIQTKKVETRKDTLEILQGREDKESFTWSLQVLWFWVKEKFSLTCEVLCIAAMYYLDVGLDFRMMWTFADHKDYMFCTTSAVGVILTLVFTMMEMGREITQLKERGSSVEGLEFQLIVIGFLLPFQGHMLYICGRSLYDGKPHIFLYTAKLAESVIEATISGAVQTYATIFRSLDWWEMVTAYASIGFSYVSMALAFTTFDRRDKGLGSLPGIAEGWFSNRGSLILVYLCRMCEITSRITSLGLFQLIMRKETFMWKFPIAFIISVDGLVLLFLIIAFQSSTGSIANAFQYFAPSIIGFMNPLLTVKNTHTLPAWVYYTFRVLELGVMGLLMYFYGEYHGPHDKPDDKARNNLYGLDAMEIEFRDDYIPLYAFCFSTVGWMLLVPFIRTFCTDHVMLRDRELFRNRQFDPLKDRLRDDLLTLNRDTEPKQVRRSIEFHRICDDVLRSEMKHLAHAIRQNHRSMSIDRVNSRKNFRSSSKDLSFLNLWVRHQVKLEQDKEAGNNFKADRFLDVVRVWYNVGAFFQFPKMSQQVEVLVRDDRYENYRSALQNLEMGKKTLFLEYLEVTCQSMQDQMVQDTFRNIRTIEMLLRVLPSWPEQWDGAGESSEKRIFVAKCQLVVECMKSGWKFHRSDFVDYAIKLCKKFGAKRLEDLRELVGETDLWFMCSAQLTCLVKMWFAVPDDSRAKVFRADVEVLAMIELVDFLSLAQRAPQTLRLQTPEEQTKFLSDIDEDLMVGILEAHKTSLQPVYASKAADLYEEVRLSTRRRLSKISWKNPYGEAKLKIVDRKTAAQGIFKSIQTEAERIEIVVELDVLDEVEATCDYHQFYDQMVFEDLAALQRGVAKSMRTTALLQLGNSVSKADLEHFFESIEASDEDAKRHFNLLLRHEANCRKVIERCTKELEKKGNQLQRYLEKNVEPQTASFNEEYRKHKEKEIPTIKLIGERKTANFNALTEAEKVMEHFLEFLKVVDSSFEPRDSDGSYNHWNADVKDKCDKLRKAVNEKRDDTRKAVSAYWNEQEGLVTEEAKNQERLAVQRGQEAAAKEQDAIEAQNKAEEEKQKAQDEKIRAEKAEQKAQQEKQKAEEKEQEAVKASQKASDEKKAAEGAEAAARDAEAKAKQETENAKEEKEAAERAALKAENEKKNAERAAEASAKAAQEAKEAAESAAKARQEALDEKEQAQQEKSRAEKAEQKAQQEKQKAEEKEQEAVKASQKAADEKRAAEEAEAAARAAEAKAKKESEKATEEKEKAVIAAADSFKAAQKSREAAEVAKAQQEKAQKAMKAEAEKTKAALAKEQQALKRVREAEAMMERAEEKKREVAKMVQDLERLPKEERDMRMNDLLSGVKRWLGLTG